MLNENGSLKWLVGVALGVLLVLGAGAAYWSYRPLGPGDPAKGKRIYEVNCIPCHGIKGEGDGPRSYFIVPPPRNFTDRDEMEGKDQQTFLTAVTEGKDGTAMLAWNGILSEQQIRDVVAYVMSFEQKAPSYEIQ